MSLFGGDAHLHGYRLFTSHAFAPLTSAFTYMYIILQLPPYKDICVFLDSLELLMYILHLTLPLKLSTLDILVLTSLPTRLSTSLLNITTRMCPHSASLGCASVIIYRLPGTNYLSYHAPFHLGDIPALSPHAWPLRTLQNPKSGCQLGVPRVKDQGRISTRTLSSRTPGVHPP